MAMLALVCLFGLALRVVAVVAHASGYLELVIVGADELRFSFDAIFTAFHLTRILQDIVRIILMLDIWIFSQKSFDCLVLCLDLYLI